MHPSSVICAPYKVIKEFNSLAFFILSTPPVFISGCANAGKKKFSIAFIKYFSKFIRQMKGILFVDFLIQKSFLIHALDNDLSY